MAKKVKCDYLQRVASLVEEAYGTDKATTVMAAAWTRYMELLEENEDDPKAYWIHTRERIYPAISLFDGLLAAGVERQEAADFVVEYYHKRSEKSAVMVKKLVSLPGLYKHIPSLFSKLTLKMFGEKSGFQYKLYDTPKNEMKIDMLLCPYFENCKKYGCPEIARGFCEADDICYGNMHPKLIWGRTQTLAKGGDRCDFNIKVKE